MKAEGFKPNLAAILSADFQGYSRPLADNEPETVPNLTFSRKAVTNLIQDYQSRIVDSPSDNIPAEFVSRGQTAECAIEVQKSLNSRNVELPHKRNMAFRIEISLTTAPIFICHIFKISGGAYEKTSFSY